MIRNYFKTAWRNLWKSKSFSFINLLGLTLGMIIILMIMLWVQDERGVNAFHKHSSRLYNIYELEYADGKVEIDYSTPGLIAYELKKIIPEVQYAASYARDYEMTFRVNNMVIKERGQYATEDFFKVLTYPLLQGSADEALRSPESITLSKKMAVKFFGSPEAAIGKTIRCENRDDFIVTAVFDDVPHNSTIKFDYIINWQNFLRDNQWAKNFDNTGPFVTILLKEQTNPGKVRTAIRNFLDNYNVEQGPGYRIELDIQRYDEMYLYSNFKNGQISGGRIEYVKLFSIVAVFILLIACINFMNLSTARSVKRAKEIGIRKVAGATRSVLIPQFIGEAMFLAFLALLASLVLIQILLPVFNDITGKHIMLPASNLLFWLKLSGLVIITGGIAGSYPALFLSSFQPVKVLKGDLKTGTGAILFRKGLVIFQFTLSTLLIVGTIVVSRQLNYIQTKNLGFDRENLIYISLEGELTRQYGLFKQEAVKLPGARQVTRISSSPTDIDVNTTGVEWEGKHPEEKPPFTNASVGYDFIKTMNAQLLQGRDFSKDFPTDSMGFLINESALARIGYKDPVGSPLKFWDRKGTIIGVVKDFHFRSLHEPVKPLILRFGEHDSWGNILVRTEAGKTRQVLTGLEKLCKRLNPEFPFSYRFADEEFQKLYKSETIISRLSNYFSFLAIFISCLGLLGLVMFTAEQRSKEIGIRKVLGASGVAVFTLLSRDFLKLVIIAILFATPVAWWIMNKWLQAFAYRINISWWMFALAGFIAVLIALFTISFQAIKAVIANPIKSLRTE